MSRYFPAPSARRARRTIGLAAAAIALATAVGVGLAPARAWTDGEGEVPEALARLLPANAAPELIENVRERNIAGRLWELPGLDRDGFPG